MNNELIINYAKQLISNNGYWELLDNAVKVDEKIYLLTPWRYNRQLIEIRNLAIKTKALRDICSYKSQRFETANKNIFSLLSEELDTCEWILDDKIVSVFADINRDKYMSLILKTESGILCNIVISTTLPKGTNPISKHEIVGKEGMISERPVSIQIPEQGTYLFSEEKVATYTDNDLYMFGLTPREVMITDNIIDLVSNKPNTDLYKESTERNKYLITCVKQSSEISNVVIVGGEI